MKEDREDSNSASITDADIEDWVPEQDMPNKLREIPAEAFQAGIVDEAEALCLSAAVHCLADGLSVEKYGTETRALALGLTGRI